MSNTPKLGNTILAYTQTTSTNELAKHLIQQQILPTGSVITARFQSAGKGQHGKVWDSDDGMNLLCSYVIPQMFLAIENQVYLNMAVSMAVCSTIKHFCSEHVVKIKWPNDVYVNNKKAAGILIENIVQGDNWKYCIAGIGINVHQKSFEQLNATSITLENNTDITVEDVLKKLSEYMNTYVELVANSDCATLHLEYQKNLYKIGESVTLIADEAASPRSATLVGVDRYGKLVVNENGHEQSYSHAEVRIAQVMNSINKE